jgi:hypothetical protein
MNKKELNFWYWLVGKLPKKILYFSFMTVMVHGTTGEHGDTDTSKLTGMDAVKRFANDYDIE